MNTATRAFFSFFFHFVWFGILNTSSEERTLVQNTEHQFRRTNGSVDRTSVQKNERFRRTNQSSVDRTNRRRAAGKLRNFLGIRGVQPAVITEVF